MGKSLKRRKLREARAEAEAASASSSAPTPRSAPLPPALLPATDAADAEPPSDADVAAALRVVGFVGAHPHLFAERRYRPLRAALHPLVLEQLKRYEPVDYAARVTSALQAQRWEDGLRALRGLRAHGQAPKQGTVQRWVRDVDGAADGVRMRLLDAILRARQPQDAGAADAAADAAAVAADAGDSDSESGGEHAAPQIGEQPIEWQPVWQPRGAPHDTTTTDDAAADAALDARVVFCEAAAERQPPQHHDRRVFACAPGAVHLAARPPGAPGVERQEVPNVPGAFVINGVLTAAECARLRRASEALGYTPDHPVGKEVPSGIGAVEWLADDALVAEVYARCRAALPPQLRGGDVVGLARHVPSARIAT